MITPTPLSRALPCLRSRFPQPAFRTTTSVLRCLHVDAHHPHGLYWHDLGKYDNVPVYALSFLKEPPKSAYSITNIGLVRGTELNAKTFEQAPEWMQLVHAILSQRFTDSIWLQTMATSRPMDGYIHINDERNPPDENRVADPDDILAMVLTQQGQLVSGSWEAMPTYRLYSPALGGLMALNPELHGFLMEGLRVAKQIEDAE